ncbi:hypothetical protein KPL40_13060 [Clostridium gasigenes]|uniref:hypothetical protein n=1 Tax=Clostridium gasigenes TaxID=94869 RepID=UPI001C0CE76E|nr:hypothetical protein [Clostridium gasigenes]MBU3133381.1 hypothetical protein [Clostridium gasigenes]
MKKRKISLIVVAIAILTMGIGGCSKEKTVIVGTNVQDSKNEGVNISEETINLKMDDNLLYTPKYFDGDKIYGTFGPNAGRVIKDGTQEYPIAGLFKKNLYTVESDGTIKATDREPVFYDDWIRGSKGVSEDIDNNKIGNYSNNDIYYYDDKTGEKRKIGTGYSSENKDNIGGREVCTQIVEGQSEFAYTMLNEREHEWGIKINAKGENKLLNLQILGVNNGEKYEYKGTDVSAIGDIIYSEITEKFYALDVNGKLYNIELKDNEAKFSEVDNIDFKGLDDIYERSVSVNNNGEILIFNKLDKGQVLTIIYNAETKKTTYINKDNDESTRILQYFTEGNKVVFSKTSSDNNHEIYVGELKDDYIKVYTKLDIPSSEGEMLGYTSAIMSDDGKKMLLSQYISRLESHPSEPCLRTVVNKMITFN